MNGCVLFSYADHRPDHMADVERSGPPHRDDRIFGDPSVMLHSAAMGAWLPAASFSTLDLVEFGTGSGTQFLAWRLSQLMTEAVMKRSWICLCFLMVLGGPGFAQTRKAEPAFYIVLNSLTNTCRVVDRFPQTDTPNITIASDTIYRTRTEAEAALKALKPCNQ
jgi:hypothetical protein